MSDYRPPFALTGEIASLMTAIGEQVGQLDAQSMDLRLRRINRIRSVAGSLAIEDGNGRIGRLWQTVLLSRWRPEFAWLPVESMVHRRQVEYYAALQASTDATDCAPFIRFMLESILASLGEKATGKTPLKTPLKTPDAILNLLRKQPDLSFLQIAAQLGKSESAIKRAVRGLRESGRLVRIGPDKGGRWKVLR